MKVSIIDEDNIIVYMNNLYINELIFDNKDELENYFKELFSKLKKFYKINIFGYYNIKVFIDKFYGIIIDLQKEDIDYFDYFGSQIDMRIIIEKNNCFLYKIDDLFSIDKTILNKINVIRYKGNFYIRIIEKLSEKGMSNVVENSIILYDDEINNIVENGKIIAL